MVSVEDMGSEIHSIYGFLSPSSATSSHIWRDKGRSKRTVRSSLLSSPNPHHSTHQTVDTTAESINSSNCSFASARPDLSTAENLTDSFVDLHLGELACSRTVRPSFTSNYFVDLSHSHSSSEYSVCSSDISGELHRLATLTAEAQAEEGLSTSSPPTINPTPSTPILNPNPNSDNQDSNSDSSDPRQEPCLGFLLSESFCREEILEIISPEDLSPTVKICIDGLRSCSTAVKRAAAAKLRLLAKNRSDNRVLIVEAGAVPALTPLLRCPDPVVQEHAVTALLNLSLHPANKAIVAAAAGAVKSLVYVLKTGTETAKQNAAAALMSLAMVDENKLTIGACGAIPPLVALLVTGTARGKKDALTTLYKLCSARQNKERAVRAGAVKPLVGLVAEGEVIEGGMVAEKAMVVLSSLTGINEGKEAIVEEGGIGALVEAVEDSSDKGKEFAVMTLLQLCVDTVKNRGLLVREGGIPPLVALSQSGTAKAKHKAETLLGYLREPRQEGPSSSP